MGYRIDYAVGAGTLQAVVSGRSTLAYAGLIARDIAQQARHEAARRVLIDLRGLIDRVGTLANLLTPPARVARRVAVVDVSRNDRHYVFSEVAARRCGAALRHFDDASAALHWLREGDD